MKVSLFLEQSKPIIQFLFSEVTIVLLLLALASLSSSRPKVAI